MEAGRHGIAVHVLPLAKKRPQGVLALRRLLSEHAFDVINTHSSTDSWLVALAARTTKAPPPIVRTRHISAPVPRDRLTRWLYTRATAQTVTTGDAIRAALIRDIGVAPDRVSSIPTGIDPARFPQRDKRAARRALELPEDAPLIGICATLRSWKGHRFLVDAMPLLSHKDAQLVIVGDGPQRAALAQQIATLGLRRARPARRQPATTSRRGSPPSTFSRCPLMPTRACRRRWCRRCLQASPASPPTPARSARWGSLITPRW